MDWFRNVPNVIRIQSGQPDQHVQHMQQHQDQPHQQPQQPQPQQQQHQQLPQNQALVLEQPSNSYNEDPSFGNIRDGNDFINVDNNGGSRSRLARQPTTTRDDRNRSNSQANVLLPTTSKKSSNRDDNCALCGEVYSDPRLLPCLHSFCRRCLEHTVNPRSTTLTCHLCRMEIVLKVGWLSF